MDHKRGGGRRREGGRGELGCTKSILKRSRHGNKLKIIIIITWIIKTIIINMTISTTVSKY